MLRIHLREKKVKILQLAGFPTKGDISDPNLDCWVQEVSKGLVDYNKNKEPLNIVKILEDINEKKTIRLTGRETPEEVIAYWKWQNK